MQNTVIYLFGFPATGKYTIGKAIATQSGALLIDNHYINNPVFGLIEKDGVTPLPKRVWQNTRKIRDAIFDTMIHISPHHYSFVLTNALKKSDPEDAEIFVETQNVAEARKALFIPVRLLCTAEAMKKRIISPDRKKRMKDICMESVLNLHRNDEVLRPDHPNLLELDVSDLSPDQAAQIILDFVQSRSP